MGMKFDGDSDQAAQSLRPVWLPVIRTMSHMRNLSKWPMELLIHPRVHRARRLLHLHLLAQQTLSAKTKILVMENISTGPLLSMVIQRSQVSTNLALAGGF